jgi:hypothetical protein
VSAGALKATVRVPVWWLKAEVIVAALGRLHEQWQGWAVPAWSSSLWACTSAVGGTNTHGVGNHRLESSQSCRGDELIVVVDVGATADGGC